jgi:hypothetical protein
LREIDLEESSEKTKQEQERTKQLEVQEKTKQMEIQLQIRKLELAHELEMKKLELQYQTVQQPTQPSVTPAPTKVKKQLPEDKKEIVKKFMDCRTEFSTKRSDCIFVEDLYNNFVTWFQEISPNTATPASQSNFSKIVSNIPQYTIMRVAIGPRVGTSTPRKTAMIHRKLL